MMTAKDTRPLCRVCRADQFMPIVDFGEMPVAHRLLQQQDSSEQLYSFALEACITCGLLQNHHPIDPEELYRNFNYCFSDWKAEKHLPDEINFIFENISPRSALDVGCNDGKFLQALRERSLEKLAGIEPNPLTASRARERGLDVRETMATPDACKELVREKGQFDLITCRQVMEHVTDLQIFFAALRELVIDDGFLFVDVPDLMPSLLSGDCSTFWEEHVQYFVKATLELLLRNEGFTPIASRMYNFSGGTIAILARKTGVLPLPSELSKNSVDSGLLSSFGTRIDSYRTRLVQSLRQAKEQGFFVAIYGSGVRACMAINGLNLGAFIDVALDDQLERQQKFVPGARIPITAPETLNEQTKPILCILAVNAENDEVVSARLKSITTLDLQFITICAPGNIHGDLDRLDRDLAARAQKLSMATISR